jgi:anti-anti-sigma factor
MDPVSANSSRAVDGVTAFSTTVTRSDHGAVVIARGEVDIATGAELDRVLTEAAADGLLDTTLMLGEVTFIDSSGLAVLIKAHQRAAAQGTRFVVTSVRPNVRKVFELGGMFGYLDIVDDGEAVVDSAEETDRAGT